MLILECRCLWFDLLGQNLLSLFLSSMHAWLCGWGCVCDAWIFEWKYFEHYCCFAFSNPEIWRKTFILVMSPLWYSMQSYEVEWLVESVLTFWFQLVLKIWIPVCYVVMWYYYGFDHSCRWICNESKIFSFLFSKEPVHSACPPISLHKKSMVLLMY